MAETLDRVRVVTEHMGGGFGAKFGIDVWDQWDSLFAGTDGPGPHRIRISPYDPERRVWVVHETGHQIFVFSNDGSELRMTLGEKNVGGSDRTHFGQPQANTSDKAIAINGYTYQVFRNLVPVIFMGASVYPN